ncbi:MAG: Uma2 family endonuclease [Candidatus Competibacteraceae bacterium]|nr:Uma2 family endonuclease [Candidatus Competibacteraceae bacterium]
MPATATEQNLYARLEALPDNLVGEIINGHLHTHPRPAGPHAVAHSVLNMDIGSAYQRGRGGPGGWWIITEPEIHFVTDREVAVPDIAGWRRETMPHVPADHRFTVPPDWVCEVLSPSTAKIDRIEKMPLYGRYGVHFVWLVDPLARTLEVFELQGGRWTLAEAYRDDAQVCAVPFTDLDLRLSDLWAD